MIVRLRLVVGAILIVFGGVIGLYAPWLGVAILLGLVGFGLLIWGWLARNAPEGSPGGERPLVVFCSWCGAPNPDETRFCDRCGQPLSVAPLARASASPGP